MVFLVAATYDKNIAINSSTDKTCYLTGNDETCYKSFQTENIRQQWQILSNRIILFAMCVAYDGIRLCVKFSSRVLSMNAHKKKCNEKCAFLYSVYECCTCAVAVLTSVIWALLVSILPEYLITRCFILSYNLLLIKLCKWSNNAIGIKQPHWKTTTTTSKKKHTQQTKTTSKALTFNWTKCPRIRPQWLLFEHRYHHCHAAFDLTS